MSPIYAALIGIIALLVIAILTLSVMWRFERRDLYNRIMCGSIAEYERVNADKAGNAKSKPAQGVHARAIKKWNAKAIRNWK